ncbi:galactofuranosyltransferase [Bombiscardovia nodaiensis]|uniref:Galactofuranosyltransferase n=1 Tax=Bombiscardovia nodaiensis TaxID=2932181 RepID=A0ABM8BAL2_9BIFI|nr:galactofuranosyltransferase [Bombiscardovia nodaiensis]
MPTMKFANVLLETNPRAVAYPDLYCRADQPVVFDDETGEWSLYRAGYFDFTTYFNSLSVMKLKRYTRATGFSLHVELKGAACTIQQMKGDTFSDKAEQVEGVEQHLKASDEWQSVDMPLLITEQMVIVGFAIETEGRVQIRKGSYELEYEGALRDVELALATTTFKKEQFIINNVNLIRENIVESDEDIANHFNMYVIDNGRSLDVQELTSKHITIIPNDNVGGSGGFARGMLAAMDQTPKATNILLMDDDVAVSPESVKRTYNLLRIVKPAYEDAMISGAMLNYEVGEDQWEDIGFMTPEGTFAPCKPSMRMTLFADLIYNELYKPAKFMRKNMYAAWWYCCIPIPVIERNGMPLPVFVRCDDAEYGIRCKVPFITMNGLCIWHMSFHERYNAAVERYQTTRNTMVAQATCGMAPESDFMYELHNNVRLELKKFGYSNAELCLDAFEDFLKGPEFFSKQGVAEETFMRANKRKEKLYDLDTLQEEIDKDYEMKGLQIKEIDRQLIDGDKPRTRLQRLEDYVTDNGQRYLKTQGSGYAVIPLLGWVYPAGVIRGKDKLIVIDWYNKKGAIRVKDPERYAAIKKRYNRDMRYYKANVKRLKAEYAAARRTLTSQQYWRKYLKMD